MKQWFQQLNQREQGYLLAAGLAIGLYLMYMVLWKPLDDRRDQMIETNARVEKTLARVQSMSAELQQLESAGGSQQRRNLSAVINATTGQFKITPSRIQAGASGSSQIRFEEVDFASLTRWLHRLEAEEGLSIRDASISQGDLSGRVDASIRIAQGG